MFIDETTLCVTAGDGGKGCVAFRREKFVPRGGPSGGDGGKGGDVVAVADSGLSTLLDLHYRKHIRAQRGAHGGGKGMTGKSGEDAVLRVPAGTLAYDAESGELLGDLTEHDQRLVLAHGGRGGLGNTRFRSSTRQAPDYAQPGEPGEQRTVRLELKVLADAGIVGFPNVGKSTLISRISNAKPKIADYPFTTLTPNLGLVRWRNYDSFVVADLPGLVEGAHQGRGLGHRFLRHMERTRVVVHLLEAAGEGADLPGSPERGAVHDYEALRTELESFSAHLAALPEIVVLNKMDLPATRERATEIAAHFEQLGVPFLTISAVTGEGLPELVDEIGRALQRLPAD